jgi:hypothetical protein
LGQLVPMTYNLWIGKTKISSSTTSTKTSSGLHHDFHDNLYCLVSGQKAFRIAPPETVRTAQMSGTLHTLYENGRIVYEEQLPKIIVQGDHESSEANDENDDDNTNNVDTTAKMMMIRPDGAFESVERIMELENSIEAINAEMDETEDETKLSELETKLNAMEEELLDLETMGNEEENDESSEDDDDDNEVDIPDGITNDDEDATAPPKFKRQKVETSPTNKNTSATNNLPVNFCLQEPKQNAENHSSCFETITISAGDLFFLPTGWFHEVQSHGGLHMALNYWTHPIDVDGCFERPYNSKFWERDWESRGL